MVKDFVSMTVKLKVIKKQKLMVKYLETNSLILMEKCLVIDLVTNLYYNLGLYLDLMTKKYLETSFLILKEKQKVIDLD